MSRRLNRLGLLVLGLLASEAWALGLGDIRLDSALNEPLRAEIELLSATDEELGNLRITLASADTFERYGIDRPLFLSRLRFDVVNRGSGQIIRVTSTEPVTEPFVTFLVEANWARGRLLREYTVLLDPPTFAPAPAAAATEAVSAPRQAPQADRGRIERPAPAAAPRPVAPGPGPAAAAPDSARGFDTDPGGDYRVSRGDTLWRIAEQVRPDNRLTMNQTMLAIYEANPGAFAGNINVLRANTRLRIPSADEIFRIGRAQALEEIRRQNQSWRGAAAAPQTTLTLVPPDRDQTSYQGAAATADSSAAEAAAAERIRQLERQIDEQASLLEIRDNELAELRAELARLRAERAAQQAAQPLPADEPPTAADAADAAVDEPADDIFVEDESAAAAGDEPTTAADTAEDTVTEPPATRVVAPRRAEEPGLLDTIINTLTGFWGIVGAALVAVLGLLVWFARRAGGRDDEADTTGVWDALDADADSESVASTERLRARARDEDASIVVVEQAGGDTVAGETLETPSMAAADAAASGDLSAPEPGEAPVSLEDTFSSETAINLDQSDPVAEADFHMAYGLYDQAADLINGALAVEPNRSDLMAKLCEIYFVWGNRDAFVEAAGRLKDAAGEDPAGQWDKVVIMGQQIAGDHALFADVKAGGAATQEIDLDFEGGTEGSAALDIDFAGGSVDEDDGVIDLSEDEAVATTAMDDDALDFSFDDDTDTGASITRELTREMPGAAPGDEPTVESPTLSGQTIEQSFDSDTMESPTIEQPIDDDTTESPTIEQSMVETSELPSLDDDSTGVNRKVDEATAEIDLDDLGLDLDGLADDLGGDDSELLGSDEETGTDFPDDLAATGRNRELDEDLFVRTGSNLKPEDELLDATGQTQVLSDDFTVETANRLKALDDDDATVLAPGPGAADMADYDFAKTEALPKESFGDDSLDDTVETPTGDLDETVEKPVPGATDMDLDLDDLTAALKLSESGDTVEQQRDDATVEQPRFGEDSSDLDLDLGLDEPTQALGPEEVSDDLQEARTMTEVGTKLDLARAYVDMGDPGGARNILEEVLEEGDESQRQQAQQLLDSLPG